MRYLLPFALAVVAFFVARQFHPGSPPPPVSETVAIPDAQRPDRHGFDHRARIVATYENANPALLERLRRSGRLAGHDRWELLRRSAKADPKGTWNWVEEHNLSWSDRMTVARIWFPNDPEAVLSRLDISNHNDSEIAGSLLGMLGGEDAAAASAVREHLDTLLHMALWFPNSISFPRPENGGAEILESLPPGPSRDFLTHRFASSWLRIDMPAALVWMENLPATHRDEILQDFFEETIKTHHDPDMIQAATDWLMNDACSAVRARSGPTLVNRMAREDPAGALAWAFENLESNPLARATESVIPMIFESDPDQAIHIVEELPPGNLLNRSAHIVARAWAATEPSAAVEWWLDVLGPKKAEQLDSTQLGRLWLQSDPEGFRSRLADPSQAPLPSSMAYPAIHEWAGLDPGGALKWASSLPADRRDTLVHTTYRQWADSDPAAAGAALLAQPNIAPESARTIAARWYSQDKAGSIQWVASLPPGEIRTHALAVLKSRADSEVQRGGTVPPALQELID